MSQTILSTILIFMTMVHLMPPLPYVEDALDPIISKETVQYHYGKHLQTYLDNLNKLIKDTPYEEMTLDELVVKAPDGPLYNNAGQALNHTLYFEQFTPAPVITHPQGRLLELINQQFGSFDEFKRIFTDAGIGLFGSGWVWLAQDKEGMLVILQEANGGTPLRKGFYPLFCFDVWEHAYYLDYQNRRAEHLKKLWDILNWDTIEMRLRK